MSKLIDNMIGAAVYTVVSIFFIFAAYAVIVWLPFNVYAEAKCLEKGYPAQKVSVGLEIYCMNLDGSVTVSVDKID